MIAKSQRRERALLKAAVEAQLPTVIIAPDEISTDVQVVRCNNVAAGTTVGAHLANLGHRQIGFVAGPSTRSTPSTGCADCATSSRGAASDSDADAIFVCGSYTSEAGGQFAREFFEKPIDLTAVVLANDALAFGFMRVAQQRGVRMPEDLSIVGFDGLPHGALFCPALTTVSQPMRDMGRVACCRLFEAIEDPGRLETTEFPMVLIERESTGPVATGVRRCTWCPRRTRRRECPVRRSRLLSYLIAAGAAILSFRPIYEPDLWWHLSQGREDVSGHLVRTNVFSFTYPDYRQRFTPWLFDSVAYLSWAAGERSEFRRCRRC